MRTLCMLALVVALALSVEALEVPKGDPEIIRFCSALHNEGCSEQNPVPGPCSNADKCRMFVCTKGNGSCADDSSLSWCSQVECKSVMHRVRQATNVLGQFNDAANPRSIE